PAADGGGKGYFRLELLGTAGALSFPSGPPQELWHCPEPLPLPGRSGWRRIDLSNALENGQVPGDMHAANQALVRDLLEAVEGEREPVAAIEDGRAAVEMVMAVYVSHLRGVRVPLPLDQREHPLAQSGA